LNADITKLAMGRLYHRLRPFNARLINVVHDELVFEVPKDDAEELTLSGMKWRLQAGNI
jgi:DNA polymerase I-like protein with 3'-5' exonuclease and polymerase domains